MKLSAELEIATIKVSRKNSGPTQGPLSMYFTLKGDLEVDAVSGLFPTATSFEAEMDRWDAGGELRHNLVKDLSLEIEGTGVRFEIKPEFGDPLVFQTADVDRVSFGLKSGRRVDVSLRVLVEPTDLQLGPALTWLGNTMACELWSRQAELEFGDEAGPGDDAGDGDPGDEAARRAAIEARGEDSTARTITPPRRSKVPDGEALVPGQKPPQRPRGRKPAAAGVH